MTQLRIYNLTDIDLPEELKYLKTIFMTNFIKIEPEQKKSKHESLHDYLGRINVRCWCRHCMADRKQETLNNNMKFI